MNDNLFESDYAGCLFWQISPLASLGRNDGTGVKLSKWGRLAVGWEPTLSFRPEARRAVAEESIRIASPKSLPWA